LRINERLKEQGMKIRKAALSDAEEIARVHVDSWRCAYRGFVPASILDELSYEQKARQWEKTLCAMAHQEFVYVAENAAQQIVGFASGGPALFKDNSLYRGELFTLYILDDYQRQGLGQRLFLQVVECLLQLELPSMLIWVLTENPARRFYEKLGGELVATGSYQIQGIELPQVAYGWLDIAQFTYRSS
jgi:ribosomal protein S18 acetylase RimI-like enzyme